MQLVDTHAHVYLPEFDGDRAAVLERAAQNGVTRILMPAIDTVTHQFMLETEAQWPWCMAMIGLHPCSVASNYMEELAVVETYLKQRPFAAIGEIGLDFYWDTTFKQQQYDAFETQIMWALHANLPIVIHSRNAMAECIEVVQRYPGLRGVFHCFSGTADQARQIIELQFFLGIGGVITYKKSGLDSMIREVGLSAVVLETDAPYLTPVPHRGKRNESSYLRLIATKLADSMGCSIEDVAHITTQNATKLFALP
jgi:TatD DNase family protein